MAHAGIQSKLQAGRPLFCGMTFAAVVIAAHCAVADVSFTGSDGVLSKVENWSAAPTADSALLVDGSGLAVPDNAFSLGGSLTGASLKVLNFGSRALFDLSDGTLGVPSVEVTANTGDVVISGGATGLASIYAHNGGTVVLSNGVYDVTGKVSFGYSELKVAADAKLCLTRTAADGCGASDVSGNMTIDGGELLLHPATTEWYRFYPTVYGLQTFKVTNGGKFTCEGRQSIFVTGYRGKFIMDKESVFDMSGGTSQRGFTFGWNVGEFTVEGSTFKCANMMSGYFVDSIAGFWHDQCCNELHDVAFTFRDSTVSLWNASKSENSGIVMNGPKTYLNTMTVEGAKSSFDTGVLYWGGQTNVFQFKDGTFAIDRLTFFDGRDNKVLFSGGTGSINKVTGKYVGSWQKDFVYYGVNGLLSFSGENKTTVNTSFELSAPGMVAEAKENAAVTLVPDVVLSADGTGVEVSGDAQVDMTPERSFKLTGDGNYVSVSGSGCITGHLQFKGTNGRLFIGDGATFRASLPGSGAGMNTSLSFGQGTSGNELVISNGTFESAMFFGANAAVFLKVDPPTGSGHEAIPFTNCPNSRIVFQGDRPKFLSTSNSRWKGDHPYFAGALGCTYDPTTGCHTDEPFALQDALRLRYELPETPYAAAPFQNTVGNGWIFGGNAVFEFDATNYRQQKSRTRIPLVFCKNKFLTAGKLYIDVAQLNATNAGNLPVFNGRRSRLALNTAGDTLELVVPGTSGLVVILK